MTRFVDMIQDDDGTWHPPEWPRNINHRVCPVCGAVVAVEVRDDTGAARYVCTEHKEDPSHWSSDWAKATYEGEEIA